MNLTDEEIDKHWQIGFSVVQVLHGLQFLTEHATEIDNGLVTQMSDAMQRFADARRQLLSPLARAMPASDARN